MKVLEQSKIAEDEVITLSATPVHETTKGRAKLAAANKALPDGSFPIPNVSYLKKAIKAVGRAAAGKRPALGRLIRKRGRELGAWNVVKGSWADNTAGATAMANVLARDLLEFAGATTMAASSDGPRTTSMSNGNGNGGDTDYDALYQKILAKLKAKGMSDARAQAFAKNSVNMIKKKKSASSSSDDDGSDSSDDSGKA